jgi:hypothetical protein
MNELKIGEIVEYKGYKITAVEDKKPFKCLRCCMDNFYGIDDCKASEQVIGDCRAEHRNDGKDVRFKLMEEK